MTPTLYIMVRNDMHSMTGGKAAAQASHATNDFELYLDIVGSTIGHPPWVSKAVTKWREDRTFGRALVLGIDDYDMDAIIEANEKASDSSQFIPQYIFGYIIDPTYPVLDGKVTHLVPVRTAAWLFTYDNAKTVVSENSVEWPTIPDLRPLEITASLKLFK